MHGNRSTEYLKDAANKDDDDDDHNDDDDDDDNKDQNSQNSANFKARRSRFCMLSDLNNT